MNSFSSSNVFNLHELKAVVLAGRGVSPEGRRFYDDTYEAWKRVWKQTLLELDGHDNLFSDNFTRQDYHLAIFHGARCVSAISFRRVYLKSDADREDSWLKIWPNDIISKYAEHMDLGLMVSWFFVDPEYRRVTSDSPLGKLEVAKKLTEMISFFFLDSSADIGFAGVRNNRSVNKLFVASGVTVDCPNVMNHGVEVDLVTWKPANVERAIEHFTKDSFALWANRIVFSDEALKLTAPSHQKTA